MSTGITRALCAAAAAGTFCALGLAGAGAAGAASTAGQASGTPASARDSAATVSLLASRASSADPVTAYVANQFSETVTPLQVATGQAGTAIPAGANLAYITITPDGKTAYVSNTREGMSPEDTVTPIQIATGKAGKAITASTARIAILSTQPPR